MLEKAEEKAMVQFLSKFDEHPFLIKFKDNNYMVGEGTIIVSENAAVAAEAVVIKEVEVNTVVGENVSSIDGTCKM